MNDFGPAAWRGGSVLLGWLCLLTAGCAPSAKAPPGLPVFPVSGQVRVAGKPAAGALVLLHPETGSPAAERGVIPSGTTGENGAFELTTYKTSDGAPAGKYTATVQWYQTPPAGEGPPLPPGFEVPVDRFEGKYKNPATSPWGMTIQEGNNVLESIEID